MNAMGAWTSSSGNQGAGKGFCVSLAITPSVLGLERQFTQQRSGQVLREPTCEEAVVVTVNEELSQR